jgi:hypothetical protein
MHPSWRDLVIEHLVSDDTARTSFLRHCGLQGFLLAMSSAGGATGQRQRPLLRTSSDWEEVRLAARRIISTERNALHSILPMLHESLRTIGTQGLAASAGKQLAAIGADCLDQARAIWSKTAIESPKLLERYYAITELLPSLPSGPDLRTSWRAYRKDALDDLEIFDPQAFEFSTTSIGEWLELALVIDANEPRFLRQMRFVNDAETLFRPVLPKFMERAEFAFDLDDADQCRDEQDRLETLATVADKIASLLTVLSEPAKQIAFASRVNERRANSWREDFEASDNDDASYVDDNTLESSTTAESLGTETRGDNPLEQHVSIANVFADL